MPRWDRAADARAIGRRGIRGNPYRTQAETVGFSDFQQRAVRVIQRHHRDPYQSRIMTTESGHRAVVGTGSSVSQRKVRSGEYQPGTER